MTSVGFGSLPRGLVFLTPKNPKYLSAQYLLYLLLCDKTFPGETQHTCLFTPDKEPITDQNTETTKVQLGEPVSFIRVAYRNMGRDFLIGAEMTYRQLHHQSPPHLFYSLITPTLIYSLRNRDMKEALLRVLRKKKICL